MPPPFHYPAITRRNECCRTILALPLVLLTGALAGAADSEQPATVYQVQLVPDIHFATVDGVELKLDLHMPQGVQDPPLVMFIHGGGWRNGDRKRCKLAWVAPRGYAVASIEYRLSHEAIFPAQIHDCKGALRWLRAHQEQHGYDATRVVVAGTSAGGHLAALLATTGGVSELEGTTAGHADRSTRVAAAIDYYGPIDFMLRSIHQPEKTDHADGNVFRLLGGPVSQRPDVARLASPAFHVTRDDPPLLIIHGATDALVHPRQSQRLAAAYRGHQLDVHLHVEENKGHGWSDPSPQEQKKVLQFLQKHLPRTATFR